MDHVNFQTISSYFEWQTLCAHDICPPHKRERELFLLSISVEIYSYLSVEYRMTGSYLQQTIHFPRLEGIFEKLNTVSDIFVIPPYPHY